MKTKPKSSERSVRGEATWVEEIGFLSAAKLLIKLRGLFLLPVIIQLLGTEQFGVWVQWIATVSLLSTLSMLGLKTATVRMVTSIRTPDDVGRWFWSVLTGAILLSLLASILLFATSGAIAEYLLHLPEARAAFAVGALYIPTRALVDLQIRLFRGVSRIRTYSILQVVDSAGQTLSMIVILLLWRDLLAAIIGLVLWQVILAAAMLPLTFKVAPLRRPKWAPLSAALKFGVPMVPGTAASAVMDKADRYLIGYFMGAGAVGIYGAAYTLGAFILQIVDPIRQTLIPRLGRLWDRRGSEPVADRLARVWRLFILLSIPAAAGLAILADDLLIVLTTPEVVEEGAPLVFWLALSQVVYGVSLLAKQVFFASQDTRALPLVYGGGAIANIVLNVILIPVYGLMGAVVATLAAYSFAGCATYLVAQRFAPLRFALRPVVQATLAAAGMGVLLEMVGGTGIGWILIAIPLGVLIYFGFLLLLRVIGLDDLRSVWNRFGYGAQGC